MRIAEEDIKVQMCLGTFLRLSIVFSSLKSNIRRASADHPENGHLNPVAFNSSITWKDEVMFDTKLHIFTPSNNSFYQRLDKSKNITSAHYHLQHKANKWRIGLVKESDFLSASCANLSSFKWEDLEWSWYNVNNTFLESAYVRVLEVIPERKDTGDISKINLTYQIVVPVLVLLLLVLVVVVLILVKKFHVDNKDQSQLKNFPTLREVDGLAMSQSFKADEYMQAKTVQGILQTDDNRVTPDTGYIVMDRRKR